jgi:NAD(P)-dependent dehydrogenase (short-subunit alcohol dehydrogenase family)
LGLLGAKVVIASRKVAVLDAAVAELEKSGIVATRVIIDVRIPEQVDSLIEQTLKNFGHLDILISTTLRGNFTVPAEELTPNGFRAVVDIVLNGTFHCSRAAARHWIRVAAVLNMTLTLAGEWGPKRIRVNAVSPGIVITDNASKNLGYNDPHVQKTLSEMVPLRRLATAEEVSHAVTYLCSPQASYVTGACLAVDGGLWLGRGLFGTMQDLIKMTGA